MIRKYKDADLKEVMKVWLKANSLAHPFLKESYVQKVKEDMKEIYIPNADTWVYEENDKVIGFISMIENEIGGLFVHPNHHSKGIGTQLVNFVCDMHEDLEVEVFRQNKIGRAFYDKFGFKTIKEIVHEESGQLVLRMAYDK